MRVLPLGGAHEVGASSTIVEFGSKRLLIDAGIRLGEDGQDQLPDLARIQEEAGHVDSIFLTHAHIDHSGALPLVHMAFPDAPIYMTPATYAVVQILFEDSLRLMEGRYYREGEIPLYPPAAVESCLGRIRPIPFDYPFRIAEGEISATFHPAGHILGASSINLQGSAGSILVSGDISVTDQRTVPGMHAPKVRPDVVIVESTYGNRLHPNRSRQESNLVHTVADVIESGGKVIIPAFAVGRAQEVILILRHAMALGQLPPFPIFVDGMVRSVCDTYSRFPTYLQQHLRVSVQKGEHPFFPAGGKVHRVRSESQRRKVLSGPPCCIIASSGMMTGGPSAYYAAALAGNPKNLIAITGYQDEEAPGRHLLALHDAPVQQRHLILNGERTHVACRVEKYSLSAHADSGEIAGLIGNMAPSQGVVLVHGDRDARESLATTIDGLVPGNILLPSNGEVLQFKASTKVVYTAPRERNRRAVPRIGLPNQALDKDTLSHLHQALWAETGKRGSYRVRDLFARWYGPDEEPMADQLDDLTLLLQDQPYFVPDRRRSYLFRLRPPKDVYGESEQKKGGYKGSMEMNQALLRAAELLPEDAGLYKRGSRQDEQKIILFFHFPAVAAVKYADILEQLREETGWTIELNDMPHHAALEERARRHIPNNWELVKNPSILHEMQAVRLRVSIPEEVTEDKHFERDLQALCQLYLDETGYKLEIHQSRKPRKTPHTENRISSSEKMEINLTYQKIDEAFVAHPDKPYKKSKKGNKIVLSFLSPIVGKRYTHVLQDLIEQTGWPIELNPEPNQYGIKQEVRTIVPDSWGLQKEPGIYKKEFIVKITLPSMPASHELESIAQKVYDRTGFRLEIS